MHDFTWVPIYNEIAREIIKYKTNRSKLIDIFYGMLEIVDKVDFDKDANLDKVNGKSVKFDDIDPITFMNCFDKYGFENRIKIIAECQRLMGLTINAPTDFNGIPKVDGRTSLVILWKDSGRKEYEVDNIWNMCEKAIVYIDDKNVFNKNNFIKEYDKVIQQKQCSFGITNWLFKISPDTFINLDGTNREYIKEEFNIKYKRSKPPKGKEYFELIDNIRNCISQSDKYNDFKEFSESAWVHKNPDALSDDIIQRVKLKEEYIELDNQLNDRIKNKEMLGEDKEAILKVRVNQGKYRELLIGKFKENCKCAIKMCLVNDKRLLIASHIKPWRDSNANERVNYNNGFLLCPNHDKLFDNGFISFDNDGNVLICEELKRKDKQNIQFAMNINSNMKLDFELNEEQKEFLKYHRSNIFKNEMKE